MKKAAVAAAAAVLVVLVLLVGCGKERETPTVRIGVALYQQEDTFLSTVVREPGAAGPDGGAGTGHQDQSQRDGRPGQSVRPERAGGHLFCSRGAT